MLALTLKRTSPQRSFRFLKIPGFPFALSLPLVAVISCGGSVPTDFDPPSDPEPQVGSISLTPSGVVFKDLGETVLLEADVRDTEGDLMANVALSWASDDEAVATVIAGGEVTARGAGEATITAEAGGVSGSTHVVMAPEAWNEIPRHEVAALRALYRATKGNRWRNNYGWLDEELRPTFWRGVTVSNGHVIYLTLPANDLDGHIPPEVADLSELRRLILTSNNLSGVIPAELGSLTKLRELHLHGNDLTGHIPSALGTLSQLERLFLQLNRLTGEIPAELGWLENLVELELWDNGLTGSLPAELGALSNLEHLAIYRNELTGPIPPELGNMSALRVLSLDYNGFQGPIPREIGSLTNLRGLGISENDFEGALPPEIGNLSRLEGLYVNGNQRLEGRLPDTLTTLVLTFFNFHETALCEPSDPAFQDWLAGIQVTSTDVLCDDS